jgi:hypothetical protein
MGKTTVAVQSESDLTVITENEQYNVFQHMADFGGRMKPCSWLDIGYVRIISMSTGELRANVPNKR